MFGGILTGAAIGLVGMFVLDPNNGRRRRAQMRDKLIRLQKTAGDAASVTGRDLKNRTRGIIAEGRAMIFGGRVDDTVLAERVRSKLGFLVRHPAGIEVQVIDGCAILGGPVLADEVQQLIHGVKAVRGIQDVENRLEVHDRPDGVPALQGDTPKPTGQTLDIFQRRWSPSTRALVGAGLLLTAGRYRRGLVRIAALTGLGWLLYNGLTREGAEWASTQGATRDSDRANRRTSEHDGARTEASAGGWTA